MPRLPKTEIPKIRIRLAAGESAISIARDYGVSAVAIRKIGRGVSHKNIPGPTYESGRRGFLASGARNRHAKLSLAQVNEIRLRLLEGGIPRFLAKDYSVSKRTIENIEAGRTWRCIGALDSYTLEDLKDSLLGLDLDTARPSKDSAEEQALVELTYRYYRTVGFPFWTCGNDLLRRSLSLLRSDQNFSLRGRVFSSVTIALRAINAYHPHIFRVRRKGKISPLELFEDDNRFRRVIRRHIRRGSSLHPRDMRRAISFTGGAWLASNFRPITARDIYSLFHPSLIVDPCMGWGGRMMAAIASHIPYVGIDPSGPAIDGNQRLLDTVRGVDGPQAVDIRRNCAEDILGHDVFRPDLIVTSPPYFDMEYYADEPTQSYRRYPTFSLWLDGFLRRLIEKATSDLRMWGVLVLVIHEDIAPYARQFALQAKLAELPRLWMSFRVHQVAQALIGNERLEPILVFRKVP